jgi:SAM-dependent methyltransferase
MSGYDPDLSQAFVAVGDDRVETVFPVLLDRLGELAPGGRLLDYGGGDGSFAARCTELTFESVATYDLSPAMCDLAEARARSIARLQVLRMTADLPDCSFDVVTCNGVWMCWLDETECLHNLREIVRLLRPGGVFWAAVTHPCFRQQPFATYRTDFDLHRYFDDGSRFTVTMFDAAGHQVQFEDTHWSLSALTRQLREASLGLAEILEVRDARGAAGSPWMLLRAMRVIA